MSTWAAGKKKMGYAIWVLKMKKWRKLSKKKKKKDAAKKEKGISIQHIGTPRGNGEIKYLSSLQTSPRTFPAERLAWNHACMRALECERGVEWGRREWAYWWEWPGLRVRRASQAAAGSSWDFPSASGQKQRRRRRGLRRRREGEGWRRTTRKAAAPFTAGVWVILRRREAPRPVRARLSGFG